MKKFFVCFLFVAVIVSSFAVGRSCGIRHALEDSEIFTVEYYDPNEPYKNFREDGTDQTIYILLDGEEYEHGMYQG